MKFQFRPRLLSRHERICTHRRVGVEVKWLPLTSRLVIHEMVAIKFHEIFIHFLWEPMVMETAGVCMENWLEHFIGLMVHRIKSLDTKLFWGLVLHAKLGWKMEIARKKHKTFPAKQIRSSSSVWPNYKIHPTALRHQSLLHFGKSFHPDSDEIKISLQFLSIAALVLKQQSA